MPTPWKHPKTGSFYLNKRIPADLLPFYSGKKTILRSLRTKVRQEAEKLLCQEWLRLQREFDQKRLTLSSATELREDQADQLAQCWFTELLDEDDQLRIEEGRFDRTLAKSEDAVSWGEPAARQALVRGRTEFVADEMEDWLQAAGIRFQPDTPAYQRTSMAFLRVFVKYLEAVKMRNQGEVVEPPKVEMPTPTLMLSRVIDAFLDERANTGMEKKLRSALGKMLETVGDKHVSDLRQADIVAFFRLVQRLPCQRGGKKRPRGMALEDMAGTVITMAPATFENNYVSPVRLFFKWAKATYQDQGFPLALTTDGITYQGDKKEGEYKQRAFEREELLRLFEGPELARFAADPELHHCFWLPVLGLYTGARINELCQINPQVDISMVEGVWCLHLTDESEGDERISKSIKTGKSRIVPVHPEIISLGFLDYVERIKAGQHKLLFPAFKPKVGKASVNAREWFAKLLVDIDIRDETLGRRLTGSHVFRHNLITYASNHEDPSLETSIGLITGHTRLDAGISRVQQGYVSKRTIGKLSAIIGKIDFGLKLPRPQN